jgi:hypothetical protein
MGLGLYNRILVRPIQIRIKEFPYSSSPIFIRWGFFVFKLFIVNIDYNGQKTYKDTFRGH